MYPIDDIASKRSPEGYIAVPTTRPATQTPASEYAARFGRLIRERREHLRIRQDDLALTSGVGRTFLIDLEAGKPTCQLGKSLVVAIALGLRPFDVMTMEAEDGPLLPDLIDEPERENG
jgi:DNA-binding XRE family transcriptional regulator